MFLYEARAEMLVPGHRLAEIVSVYCTRQSHAGYEQGDNEGRQTGDARAV